MSVLFQGKYELLEQIGQGGMATVWRAKLRGTAGFERACVVKRILAGANADEDAVQMFVREAKLCARLNHRNIVQVFDFGEADGEYFLAMEYVDGLNLLEVLRTLRGAAPPIGLVAFVVRELCLALAYAHELTDERDQPLGLIHRDVTPSNVLLSVDGSVKLLDFGVAKLVSGRGTQLTKTGTIKGKLAYMSPEQAVGAPLDARTDVFAAGIVMHELLCARRLFRADSEHDTMRNVRAMSIPAPSTRRRDVPATLDRICLRALERPLPRRYQRAADMADALDPLVRDLGWESAHLAEWLRELNEVAAKTEGKERPVADQEEAATGKANRRAAAPQPPASVAATQPPVSVALTQPPERPFAASPTQVMRPRTPSSDEITGTSSPAARAGRSGWVIVVLMVALAGALAGIWWSVTQRPTLAGPAAVAPVSPPVPPPVPIEAREPPTTVIAPPPVEPLFPRRADPSLAPPVDLRKRRRPTAAFAPPSPDGPVEPLTVEPPPVATPAAPTPAKPRNELVDPFGR